MPKHNHLVEQIVTRVLENMLQEIVRALMQTGATNTNAISTGTKTTTGRSGTNNTQRSAKWWPAQQPQPVKSASYEVNILTWNPEGLRGYARDAGENILEQNNE